MYTRRQNLIENTALVNDDAFKWVHDYLLMSEQCSGALFEKHDEPDPCTDSESYDQNAGKYSLSEQQISTPLALQSFGAQG